MTERSRSRRRRRAALLVGLGALFVAVAPLAAQEQQVETAAATEASPAATPETTPVPLADVIAAADAVTERLREVVAEVSANQTSRTVEQELVALTQGIDARLAETQRMLTPGAPAETLNELEMRWQRIADQLAVWARDLTARATSLDQEIASLPGARTTWEATRELARNSGAPPEVTQRIDAVLKVIGQTEAVLQKRRALVLTLQSRVAEQMQRAAGALRTVRAAQAAAVDRLWVQDSPPIWRPEIRAAATQALVEESQVSLGAQVVQLTSYMARQWAKLVYLGLIFAALAFVLTRIKRKACEWTDHDPALERANRILQLPVATAGVLTFLLCRPFFQEAPRLFWVVLATLALIPLVILLRRLLDRHLFPILNALVVFFIVAQLRAMMAALPVPSRILLLLEMVGGAIFLVWFIRSSRRWSRGTLAHRATLAAARVGVVLFAVVFVTNSLGYVALSNYLGTGALEGAYLAILLYAAAGILEGLIFFALQIWPLASLAVVQRHGPLLRQRLARLIYLGGFIAWVLLTLNAFGARVAVVQRVSAFINAEITVRSLHISLGAVLAFLLTIWIALLLSRFIRFVLEEDIYERLHLARGSSYAVSTILHYIILLAGFFTALAATGADMTKFAILAGAFGVGIGFGLQNIFNNFFSGLILLFERPIQVGDVVEVGTATGVVRRIGIRASIIRLPNSSELIVPNGQLISEKVTNRTRASRQAQLALRIGVAYGSEPERVIELLTQAAAGHQLVAKTPPPEAFMKEFGADALQFELMFWTDTPARQLRVQSDVAVAVNSVLRGAGIEIPFPQRTVHLPGDSRMGAL